MTAIAVLKSDDADGDDRVARPATTDQQRNLFLVARPEPDIEQEWSWLCSEGVAHAGY